MLSHRSGCTSLQPKIPKTDFEKIYSRIDKKELFDEFYECDKNYIENQYYLLKSTNELKYKGDQTKKQSNELLDSLLKAVEKLYSEKTLNLNRRDHYLSSSNTFLSLLIFTFTSNIKFI